MKLKHIVRIGALVALAIGMSLYLIAVKLLKNWSPQSKWTMLAALVLAACGVLGYQAAARASRGWLLQVEYERQYAKYLEHNRRVEEFQREKATRPRAGPRQPSMSTTGAGGAPGLSPNSTNGTSWLARKATRGSS